MRYLWIAWTIWTNGCGIAFLAAICAWFLVSFYASDGPVVRRIGDVENPTLIVEKLGTISYTIDVEKTQSCPGEWIGVLQSHTNHGPPAIVTLTRSTMPRSLQIGVHEGSRVSVQLPESVFPGTWTYSSGVMSKCPTKTRFDELARFDVEVRQ